MWTTYHKVSGKNLSEIIDRGLKWEPNCCIEENLIITVNRSMIAEATVVVFYNYPVDFKKNDLPRIRPPGQLWVLFGDEPPTYATDLTDFPDMFNWTMTYRQDSDIHGPFGFMYPLETPIERDDTIIMPGNVTLTQWVENKTDMMIWVTSRCTSNSKREKLVESLKIANVSVETFGSCGKHICYRLVKTCDRNKFWREVGDKYKFYFTGENSLCVDYITEKFWRALELGMVPLVYGGGDYRGMAPPNSFIDVAKFQSVEEIADYLNKLSNDTVEYSKYFEWRRKYGVKVNDGWGGWCKLCMLVSQYKHNPDEMDITPNNNYVDLSTWWMKDNLGSNRDACSQKVFPF